MGESNADYIIGGAQGLDRAAEERAPASKTRRGLAAYLAGKLDAKTAAIIDRADAGEFGPVGAAQPQAPQPASAPAVPAPPQAPAAALSAVPQAPAPTAPPAPQGSTPAGAPQGGLAAVPPAPPQRSGGLGGAIDFDSMTNKDYTDFMAAAPHLENKGQSLQDRLILEKVKAGYKADDTATREGGKDRRTGMIVQGAGERNTATNESAETRTVAQINGMLDATRMRIDGAMAVARLKLQEQREGKRVDSRLAIQSLTSEVNNARNNSARIRSALGANVDPAMQAKADELDAKAEELAGQLAQLIHGDSIHNQPTRPTQPKAQGQQPQGQPQPKQDDSGIVGAIRGYIGGQKPPQQQQAAPQRKFYNGRWWTRGPDGKAVPE